MKTLDKPVLVLNKLWHAIRIVPAIRALTLLFTDKASAVDGEDYSMYSWEEWIKITVVEDDECITTSSSLLKIPKVIVLSKYDKFPKKGMKLTKKNIFLRDHFTCQYSGQIVSLNDADIDHVNPKSRGGKTSWNNLVVCSKEINRKKANRTPEEAGLRLLKPPSKPSSQVIYIDPQMKVDPYWEKFIANKINGR